MSLIPPPVPALATASAPSPVASPGRVRHLALATALASALVAAGCASTSDPAQDNSASAESLYRSAKASLTRGDFLTAIDTFETLGARYPFGTYTQQSQLDVAYAYLEQDEYDSAVSAADRFIKLYPRSDDIDYAQYMKGLANYRRGNSAFEKFFPRDMARVNQNWLRQSYAEFDTLVRRYPESRYASDALERMSYLRDEMARHELITARFYFDRGAMVAVVNRISYLLEHFDGSKAVPDALGLLADAYEALGQADLAADTRRVLEATEAGPAAVRAPGTNDGTDDTAIPKAG